MTSATLKTALVTGGAQRIGEAIVRDLAAHDYAVAIHASRSAAKAEAIREEILGAGGRAVVVTGDLTDRAARERLVEDAVKALGPIGVLVNNASIFRRDSIEAFDEALFDEHF